eukprot:CAMPEP_0198331748 /NCGR_PEP_ID=MMETSP1450-20131203/17802_1 /TAXON_ID=753684 ORGANISM="Madagascaria erythrocladiodes, Strain CCMP3234" /NCGR_SAMPLE_ID=MMETSP1450 /ASSEMBLY_ACC=CAM_ASM_001115 /LENGTH=295 /DNA_ID=CAMNT_0044036159 /DNA_START=30 /DNA_END=915 /DNA_ORIENTATION=-
MWRAELPEEERPEQASQSGWYQKAKDYWKGQAPTVDGMLGGLAEIHPADVAGSVSFLTTNTDVASKLQRDGVALDVGAGIGRVAKHVLGPIFREVDLLDSSEQFIEESKRYASDCGNIDRRICCPMEDFRPEPGRYQLVWIQWCIIYLADADLVRFLDQFVQAGVPLICIKDNITTRGFLVDKEDSSVTRSDAHMKKLFQEAGLTVIGEQVQEGLPEELFAVKMYALASETKREPVYKTPLAPVSPGLMQSGLQITSQIFVRLEPCVEKQAIQVLQALRVGHHLGGQTSGHGTDQ